MILFPAIDIQQGKVVRLLQGKFDEVTEYAADPLDMAQQWVNRGAQWLHVVDLDGAQEGKIQNWDSIINIAKNVDVPVQMGGGVRTQEDIERLIDAGVKRIVLGTKVIEDRNFLKEILSRWPENITVSLDCSNGMVAQRGWTSVTELRGIDFAKELEALGLKYIIYTDIARDGMLTGPNFESIQEMLDAVSIAFIASGGISKLEDVKKLCALESQGLIGAITGKAIYEGTLNLEEALKVCSQNV